jgi:phospholipid/cholesterol/gamma-HCH transport system permease protein
VPPGDPHSHPPSYRSPRRTVVHVRGDLRTARAGEVWSELVAATSPADLAAVDLDVSEARTMDGSIAALLVELRADLIARGVRAEITGASERVRPLLELYEGHAADVEGRRHEGVVEHVGRAAMALASRVTSTVGFVGELAWSCRRVARRPRSVHLRELPDLVAKVGADAVPIVLLIDFLMGFVTAYMAARQLQLFGANLFVADLVGISMARELCPLMTAIIVLGRSGAAFTAEIGSMKVSDEIDALRTFGLPPVGWLVVPRVLALAVVLPVLTLLGDVVATIGGGVVAVTSLGLTAHGYLNQLALSVVGWDVGTGIIKSVAFALTIGIISCQQGFAASGGAEDVGRRTTSTVVTSLLALVVLDAVFTVVFRMVGV